jgi:predicted acylesterase/phospholipase RssA
MTAGTSTGSILAAGFAAPNKQGEPKFFTRELLEIYSTKGDMIFDKQSLGAGKTFLWLVVFTGVFAGVFFLLGNNLFDNKQEQEDLERIE